MGRQAKILATLEKKVKFENYSKTDIIHDWTPNNVKRLVLSATGYIIQYHVTGGKFKNLVDVGVYEAADVEEDILAIQQRKAIKATVSVLTANKILSCIEEIVFLTEGYDRSLYQYDISDLAVTLQGKHSFPRLAVVSEFACTHVKFIELFQGIDNDTKRYKLLTETFFKSNLVDVKVVKTFEKEYYKSIPLRPQHYKLDEEGGTLSARLLQHKSMIHDMKMRNKTDRDAYVKARAALEAKKGTITTSILVYEDLIQHLDEVFSHKPLIFQIEWAYRARQETVEKSIRGILKKSESLYQKLCSVDVVGISKVLDQDDDIDTTYRTLIQLVQKYCPDLKGREVATLPESVEILEQFAFRLRHLAVCKAYELYVAFVNSAGARLALRYHKMCEIELGQVKYCVRISEHCNQSKGLGVGVLDACFKVIGHELVPTKSFSSKERYETAKRILEAVDTVGWIQTPAKLEDMMHNG